jgi:menaquinone-dependent protoporphyrinogen oxidase
MNVMVAVASKHGSTWEIAEAIAGELTARGLEVDLYRLHLDEDAPDPAGYGAFVIGSGVYAGRWLAPARTFISDAQAVLASHPVWLFSSGPIGVVPRPAPGEAVDADGYVRETGAREHRLFGGRLDRSKLGFGERALVRALGVDEGDHRDFAEVTAWADEIARRLLASTSSAPESQAAVRD